MSPEEAAGHDRSLYLLESSEITVDVERNSYNGKRAYYSSFSLNDTDYKLKLTDPIAIRNFEGVEFGAYTVGESSGAYFCVSLTEAYSDGDGRCHKLVASIVTDPPL